MPRGVSPTTKTRKTSTGWTPTPEKCTRPTPALARAAPTTRNTSTNGCLCFGLFRVFLANNNTPLSPNELNQLLPASPTESCAPWAARGSISAFAPSINNALSELQTQKRPVEMTSRFLFSLTKPSTQRLRCARRRDQRARLVGHRRLVHHCYAQHDLIADNRSVLPDYGSAHAARRVVQPRRNRPLARG